MPDADARTHMDALHVSAVDVRRPLHPDASPMKRARLHAARPELPPIDTIDMSEEAAAAAATEETSGERSLRASGASDLDSLSRAFTAGCSCQRGGALTSAETRTDPTGAHCHLNMEKIRSRLEQSAHTAPIVAALPPSGSVLPPRIASAPSPPPPCSCIRLPAAAAALKRRHISPPLTPVGQSVEQLLALSVSGGANVAPAAASTAATSAASSRDRTLVRVKKAVARSGAPSPCSSLTVEVADRDALSATPSLCSSEPDRSPMSKDTDSPDDDPLAPRGATATPSYGYPLPAPLATTSIASLDSVSVDADADLLDAVSASAHSLALDEIRRIEDEENECELNFLMVKMTQQQQDSMPYIL